MGTVERPNFNYRCERIDAAGREGAKAFCSAMEPCANPYEEGTAQRPAWFAGYLAAQSEALAYNEDHPAANDNDERD